MSRGTHQLVFIKIY